MNQKEKGLTVGELTMSIGALLIVVLIWSAFKGQDQSNQETFLPDQKEMISG